MVYRNVRLEEDQYLFFIVNYYSWFDLEQCNFQLNVIMVFGDLTDVQCDLMKDPK